MNWKEEAKQLAQTTDMSWRQIAKTLGKSKSTVSDYLREESRNVLKQQVGAKMVFLDVEVSASIVAAFSMFKHFSTPDHVIQFPYMLTFAYNWLHDPVEKVYGKKLTDYPEFQHDVADDLPLIVDLWKVLDEADIVCIQNEQFDSGWFNQRCIYHGLPQPSPYRVICTLKGLKKACSLPSNSLDYSTRYFDVGFNKRKHEGISLWIRCMEGEREAIQEMLDYNVGDIPTLRELYLKIRAFIPNHPNVALYGVGEEMVCSVCGSCNVYEIEGKFATTNLSKFKSYRCDDCGTVKRDGKSVTTQQQRKNFLRSIGK